ncbi:MAG: glycosyltransferase [Bacteroidia bacterium]|nr:glycosyltransferase [Bacteroidia bacterium]
MKRILRIVNRFNLGGPTYNAAYLTKYLSPEYETMLIGGIKNDDEDSSEYILDQLGINSVIIPEMRRSINAFQDVAAYNKIKKIIKEFKPDIVHTHASKSGMLGRRAAFSMKVPVVVHTFHGHVFHSYFNLLKTKTFITIERRLAKKSSGIIAISDIQKEELSKIYNIAEQSKITVIPLGFDLLRFHENQEEKRKIFRAENHLDNDEIAVGIVGRLVPIKNHSLFVEAIANVKKSTGKKIRGFIIGDGECRTEIEDLAHNLNLVISPNGTTTLKPDIRFSSWMRKVDYAYAGLDIVALTSNNEGTPVSLIEAQASGRPIVSTNVGGISNIVIPGKTALLSETGDNQTFYKNLETLIQNPELRNSMSEKGWDFVKSKFHYSRLVEDTAKYYEKLLFEKSRY